jgi:chromosome segregation ATPase
MPDDREILKKEIFELKNKITSLALKIEKYQATIEKRNATVEKLNAKIETQKLKYEKKIASLGSDNAELQKRKDGMTAAELMSSVGNRFKNDKNT